MEGSRNERRKTYICKSHLHDWKCPKEIRVVEALPRNTMGKILNEDVRQFFLG